MKILNLSEVSTLKKGVRRWVDTYREMYKADVLNSSRVTPLEWLNAAYTETGESLQLSPRQVLEKIEKSKS